LLWNNKGSSGGSLSHLSVTTQRPGKKADVQATARLRWPVSNHRAWRRKAVPMAPSCWRALPLALRSSGSAPCTAAAQQPAFSHCFRLSVQGRRAADGAAQRRPGVHLKNHFSNCFPASSRSGAVFVRRSLCSKNWTVYVRLKMLQTVHFFEHSCHSTQWIKCASAVLPFKNDSSSAWLSKRHSSVDHAGAICRVIFKTHIFYGDFVLSEMIL